MGVYKVGRKFAISYQKDGVRVRKVVADTMEEAQIYLRRVQNESSDVTIQAAVSPTLRDYGAEFIRGRVSTHPSWVGNMYSLKMWLRTIGNPVLRDIGVKQIRDHIEIRLDDGKSNATINRDLMMMSKLMSEAVKDGYAVENPVSRIGKLPEPRGRLRFLSTEEVTRFLAVCNDPFKAIAEVALFSGLRMREVFGLRWNDLDKEAKVVYVKRKGKKDYSAVPIPRPVIAALTRQRKGFPWIFPNKMGERRDSCRSAMRRAKRESGIEDISFHTFRHTYASHAVMNGMDMRTLQVLLGHSKLDMVMRYSHLNAGHISVAVEKVSKNLMTQMNKSVKSEEVVQSSAHLKMAEVLGMEQRGALAQLGERMTGSHEVRGSIPLGSTNQVTETD
jgi:integrase